MSIVPTVMVSNTAYGAKNNEYDGVSPNWHTKSYKGNGYYGYTDGLHTVGYRMNGFVGNFTIQASLATTPGDADWFEVDSSRIESSETPLTTSGYINFSGNFVWVRATIMNFTAGTINQVIFN